MRLKVGIKFASLSIVAIVLTLIATLFGILQLRVLSDQALGLAANSEASQHAHALQRHLDELSIALEAGIMQQNPAWFGAPVQERLGNVSHEVTNLAGVLDEQGAADRVRELNRLHTTLTTEVAATLTSAEAGQWDAAARHLLNYVNPAMVSFEEQIQLTDQAVQQDVIAVTSLVRTTQRSYVWIVLIETTIAVVLLGVASWLLWRNLVVPIRRLTDSALLLARGNLDARTNIVGRHDEIGLLATAFDSMADQLSASHRSLAEKVQQRTAELEAERSTLQQTLTELQASTAEREQLLTTLARLQNPVIPVIEGVVVAPIVGQLSAQRLDQLQQTILDTVVATNSRVALLDITGVPLLDAQCAALLLQIGQALSLLGATAILVGIRPEVAQTLIAQRIMIGQIRTAIDLQRGIDLALRLLSRKIIASDPSRRNGKASTLHPV